MDNVISFTPSELVGFITAIGGAIGSLKGPLHGGANIKVQNMFDSIKENIHDVHDDDEVKYLLTKVLKKEIGDGSGLIYGMGHAIYTKSDPRAVMLKTYAKKLAFDKGYGDDFEKAKKIVNDVCAAHPLVLKDQPILVRVTAHNASSIDLVTRVWVNSGDYWTVNFDILEAVKTAFDKEGIEIPFNQLDVTIKK